MALGPSQKQLAARFQPGNCANPLGRPRKAFTAAGETERLARKDLRSAARAHTPEALEFILTLMRDDSAPLSLRFNAACEVIDRGHGKTATYAEAQPDHFDQMTNEELLDFILSTKVIQLESDEKAKNHNNSLS